MAPPTFTQNLNAQWDSYEGDEELVVASTQIEDLEMQVRNTGPPIAFHMSYTIPPPYSSPQFSYMLHPPRAYGSSQFDMSS